MKILRPAAMAAWLFVVVGVVRAETYSQPPALFSVDSLISHTIFIPSGGGAPFEFTFRGYDNFQLSETTPIATIAWQGIYIDLNNPANNPAPPSAASFGVYFLSNNAGAPGALLGGAALSIAAVNQTFLYNQTIFVDGDERTVPFYNYSASLVAPFVAQANTPYWLTIHAISNDSGLPEDPPLPFWGWNNSGTGNFHSLQTNNFGVGDRAFTTDRTFSLSPAATAIPGDFDGDSDVDGADFVVWQTNFPAPSGHTLATGDADHDGDVDGADFVVWQTHFPTSPGPAGSPVPEPGTGLLALVSVIAIGARRWSMRRDRMLRDDVALAITNSANKRRSTNRRLIPLAGILTL